jgi:signal transduction histidine kinase
LAELLDARGVLIFALNDQNLTVVDIWPAHPAAETLTLPIGFGVTGMVARNGNAMLLRADSPRNELHRQLMGLDSSTQTVARLCVPLRGLRNEIVGVLTAHRSPHHPFDEADLAAAERVASVLGLGLHAEQLWRAVNHHRTERDRLIRQAVSAQEAERRRIAFDLHDGVTTALASMAFHLSSADLTVSALATGDDSDDPARKLNFERARAELVNARDLADLAYNQTRAAISGLHSLVLDDLGLVAAIESLVQNVSRESGPSIEVHVDPAAAIEAIPDHAAAALYRIAQEALANAIKHAAAKRIVLSLRRVGNSIVFGCSDDGKGFDPAERRAARAGDADAAQHFGMSSIAERCAIIEASLRVESSPDRGTIVLVELPI